jgi:trimeric autotransporter adhesin
MTTLHFKGSIDPSPLPGGSLAALVVFACFLLSPAPNAFAVSPAPDGGYPGNNTAEGTSALFFLTSGISNTALGFQALYYNTTGNYNTADGANAVHDNRGAQNTATGFGVLQHNITGSYNTANGYNALYGNCSNNTASGLQALSGNRTGTENTAVGVSALASNTRGTQKTAVGFKALLADTRGNNNIGLGYEAGVNVGGFFNHIEVGNVGGVDNYTTRIGDGQTRTFIAGIRDTPVVGDTVVVNANGQLGTATSSARFKKEIKPMDKASEAILGLKPVSFQYKSDPTGTPQFGLIAEDVAKVNPDLVTRDRKGEIYSVRYEAVNAMLLNEFLKEHKAFVEEQRKVQEQQATITQLKSTVAQQQKDFQATMARLAERADEQASQMKKVSAQLAAASPSHGGLEADRPPPQMITNNQ